MPNNNSSMRYFLASLKPLGQFMFWGPLGLLALVLLFYWRVSENPQLLNPITEAPPSQGDGTIAPTDVLPTDVAPDPTTESASPLPFPSPEGSPGSKHWAAEYRERLSQEQLQPFSIDQPRERNKALNNTVLPQANQKSSSLFMPLLPNVPANSRPSYTPVKPLQIPAIAVKENQLQRAMEQSGQSRSERYEPRGEEENATNSNRRAYPSNAAPATAPVAPYPTTQGYGNIPTATAPVAPYPTTQGHGNIPTATAPVAPYPTTPGYPNYGNPAVPGTNPYNQRPGVRIQPSIQARPSGY
jgi:hypothetical protein